VILLAAVTTSDLMVICHPAKSNDLESIQQLIALSVPED